jgi:hypothetical protein
MYLTKKLLFVLIILITYGCTSIDVKDYTPKKQSNIPDSAFWKGGIDGGNWFLINNINNHRNLVNISIYNDQDGSLIKTKTFMLICNASKMTFIEDLKQQINFYDGEKIYLIKNEKSDCYLQPKE